VTECALLDGVKKSKINYQTIRQSVKIESQIPFTSQNKYMQTVANNVVYLKGAPEKIVDKSKLTYYQKLDVLNEIKKYQQQGYRVICFASKGVDDANFKYDGFAVLTDEIRKDVYTAVKQCIDAGIKVKILTGDNFETAYQVAKSLKIASSESQVMLGSEVDEMPIEELKSKINLVTVVARSTPKTKLKIVNALKSNGEVVAVTGDGVNDAPAIKNADIGIAMGSGSEITKEVSDIILLDDSFSTIITAIFFGRNIYLNFQRFIMFQLSVNLTAVLFIIISLITGLNNPFNAVQLLWVNLIMDGPPALTLGLETTSKSVMNNNPVKRTDNIITKKMLFRIILHAVIMCFILFMQYEYNVLNVEKQQLSTVIFTLFVLMNLFNAFNSRETGIESIFKNLKNNKPMLYTFLVTFLIQIVITEFAGGFFKTVPLGFETWIKTILLSSVIVIISEFYKFIFRLINKNFKIRKKV
ncbi:MAG: cation-transporting P-type ATPase, partial [Clostridia bacterium]|nr:cation-transporting P-type ATPase [Clostridia bacterium]